MSNIQVIIEERSASIGNFLVGRLLPFREKRMVGPFIFIDHMGPAAISPDESFDVGPHPHIGLSTLTFLFEGAITHRDSLGNDLEIKPGEVNWMTAGKGIVHSERTPDRLRNKAYNMHGLQIWVALPKHLEDMDPAFSHHDASDLPHWNEAGLDFKLIAGKIMGHTSHVPVFSPLYMLEVRNESDRSIPLSIGDHLYGEVGLYILQGGIISDGEEFGSKQILVAKDPKLCVLELKPDTVIYFFGGEPFEEERFIDWNFVSSDKEVLRKAKEDWIEDRFEKIPNDQLERVPYPERKL